MEFLKLKIESSTGGNAGAVMAGRLSENPDWNVLLLEAGPDEPAGTEIPSNLAVFVGTDSTVGYLKKP